MANQLETVIKKTQAVYKQAAKELAKKLADFQVRFAEKDKEKRALLEAGEISAQEYKSWLAGQVFQGKQWEAKAKEAAETLLHADQEAAAIVNDGCMTAYAAAMNYGTYELEKATALKTGFTLYNRETVSRLIAKNPQLLPYWKIDQKKDYVWNYQKVKSAITQGIIQGKPIPQITADLTEKLKTTNTNRMRTFARTGMTGAHNAGRMDALHRASDKGIQVKKKWLATNDDRTRDAHADLDGQIRDIDEPFDSELGPIDYPGDPSADPANVYNCRCTVVYIYPELEEDPEDTEPAPEYEQMTYDQWMEAQENQEAVQGETNPEMVTMEDSREPEPEIMEAAEELEETEPEPEIVPEEELERIAEEQQEPTAATEPETEQRWNNKEEYDQARIMRDTIWEDDKAKIEEWETAEKDKLLDEYGGPFMRQRIEVRTDETLTDDEKAERLDELKAKEAEYKAKRSEISEQANARFEEALDKYDSVFDPEYEYKKIDEPLTEKENSRAVNPNYFKDQAYTVNCQRCAVAYEMRERGFDVEALPAPEAGAGADFVIRSIFKEAEAIEEYGTGHDNTISAMEKMKEWGPGSRAIVSIQRGGNAGGHVYNMKYDGKNVWFIDSQLGSAWNDKDFGINVDGGALEDSIMFRLTRTDNFTRLHSIPDDWIKSR